MGARVSPIALFVVLVLPGFKCEVMADEARAVRPPDPIRIATKEESGAIRFDIVGSESEVALYVVMEMQVDELPDSIQWQVSCVEPGPNMMGKFDTQLASSSASVDAQGRFLLSGSLPRDAFFDCYAYGNGPELDFEWQAEGQMASYRDRVFGDFVWMVASSDHEGTSTEGFAPDDFANKIRWRELYVKLDIAFDWNTLSDFGIQQVRLEVQKDTQGNGLQEVSFLLSGDGPIFAYYGDVKKDFREYRYRFFMEFEDGRVLGATPAWVNSDWSFIEVIIPVRQHTTEVVWEEPTFAGTVVEIRCPLFGEAMIVAETVPEQDSGFLEIDYYCDLESDSEYRLRRAGENGEQAVTSWHEETFDFVFLKETLLGEFAAGRKNE